MWIELEKFLTIRRGDVYIWLVWGGVNYCECHYWKMLGDQSARVEHCLWRLLVQVLHLVLGFVQLWFHTFSGNSGSQVWVYLVYYSTILALQWWRISLPVPLLPIQSVACRGLAVKEWNPEVNSRVGVGIASDRPILWIGVFWHCRMAWATLSLLKEPWRSAFPFTIHFGVFTKSSAWLLDLRHVIEDSLCFIYHIWRNSWNILEVKSERWVVIITEFVWVPYTCW